MKVLPVVNYPAAAIHARVALRAANIRILASKGPTDIPSWCINAKPYLRAMVDANYGLEDPAMVVLYALNALVNWRGVEARQIKAALNSVLIEE